MKQWYIIYESTETGREFDFGDPYDNYQDARFAVDCYNEDEVRNDGNRIFHLSDSRIEKSNVNKTT